MLVEMLENCKLRAEQKSHTLRPSEEKVIDKLREFEADAGVDYVSSFVRVEKKKGEILLREGEVLNHLWFLEKGVARQYTTQNNVEITNDFFFSSEFIDLYDCSVLHIPSNFSIQLLTDAVLYQISKKRLSELTIQYPVLAEIEKMILACYISNMFKRILDLQSLTATERYKYFEQNHPYLFQLIPLHQIASYLGMKPETLSRIRNE